MISSLSSSSVVFVIEVSSLFSVCGLALLMQTTKSAEAKAMSEREKYQLETKRIQLKTLTG